MLSKPSPRVPAHALSSTPHAKIAKTVRACGMCGEQPAVYMHDTMRECCRDCACEWTGRDAGAHDAALAMLGRSLSSSASPA